MKTFFLVVALAGLACLQTGCQPPVSVPEQRSVSVIPPGGDISLFSLTADKALESGSMKLSELAGQPVLACYFAPWTASSRSLNASLEALLSSQLNLLPVVVDQGEGAAVSLALPAGATMLPAVKASEALLGLAGGIRALPTVVLFDAEGMAVKVWPGHVAASNTLAEIAETLK